MYTALSTSVANVGPKPHSGPHTQVPRLWGWVLPGSFAELDGDGRASCSLEVHIQLLLIAPAGLERRGANDKHVHREQYTVPTWSGTPTQS